MVKVAGVVNISERELDQVKKIRNGVAGILRKCLDEKAKTLASQGEWVSFMDVLTLLVYGTILFLNVDRLVDLAAIETFLAYHHNKESPVIAVLADVCDAFDLRCKNCLLYACSLCMVGTSRL